MEVPSQSAVGGTLMKKISIIIILSFTCILSACNSVSSKNEELSSAEAPNIEETVEESSDEKVWTADEIEALFMEANAEKVHSFTMIDSVVIPDFAYDRVGAVLYISNENQSVNVAFLDSDGYYQTAGVEGRLCDDSDFTYCGNGTVTFQMETEKDVVYIYQLTFSLENGNVNWIAQEVSTYQEILDLYYQALTEKWTSEQGAGHPLVTCLYYPYWYWEREEDLSLLDKVGFAFLDLNQDGIDELILGWIGNEFWNMEEGYVFAIYTLVDGKPVLAIEGWERNRYVIGKDGYLYNSGSGGASYTSFYKYNFKPELEGCLEPLEEVYSQGDANDYWWEHITNPEDIGVIEYTGKHEDLIIPDEDEAFSIGKSWMESGMKIEYTLFSDYR